MTTEHEKVVPLLPEKKAAGKRISKKMAFSVIFLVTLVLTSMSAFATELLAWNDYNAGTQLEKQYRKNVQKLKENPENLQARYELLTGMYRKGLHNEAKTQLQYILDHAPSDSEIVLNSIFYKGLYHSLAGQNEEAIAAFQQFLTSNPRSGEAWLNLSNLFYSTGQYEKAANCITQAGLLLPKSPDMP